MVARQGKKLAKNLDKSTKKLKNWKEELMVWSIVINTTISLIQLIITLIKLSKGE